MPSDDNDSGDHNDGDDDCNNSDHYDIDDSSPLCFAIDCVLRTNNHQTIALLTD